MRLQGEVAVVTGAGRGIGRAIAVRCAEEGADVVLAARSADELDTVAAGARREFEAEAPLQRLVQPRDVADAVVFLCSQEASAITGADLNVTSGVVTY